MDGLWDDIKKYKRYNQKVIKSPVLQNKIFNLGLRPLAVKDDLSADTCYY